MYTAAVCAVICLVLAIAAALSGCTPSDPSVVAASPELARCSATARSWPEYDACRDAVRARYGRLDGGSHD